MKHRLLGRTGLRVSEIGFGAWGIGGPALAGNIPIGWGDWDESTARQAIERALDVGINFFDTADFYGLGRSESLLGQVLGGRWQGLILATKVGHTLEPDGRIRMDFSRRHILAACDASLRRLRKNTIDLYQLHNPTLEDLDRGECIEAMEELKRLGKVRFWGVSIHTYDPEREGLWIVRHDVGDTLQLVLNILNQRALRQVVPRAHKAGYGLIARMPLQFGLLAGKFTPETRFAATDHRSFRLPPDVLRKALNEIAAVHELAAGYRQRMAIVALKFVLAHPEISTVIPGIKTPVQAEMNAAASESPDLEAEAVAAFHRLFEERFDALLTEMSKHG